MKQEAIKAPKSFRIIDVVLGVITLALAGIVLAYPSFALTLLVVFLSVALLFAGLEGLIIGTSARTLSGRQRVLRLVAGLIAIGLSLAVIVFPAAAVLSSLILLSIAFLALGAGAIGKGVMEKYMPGWARIMYVIAGAIIIGLSIPVLAYPVLGLVTIYALMATALVVDGSAYVIAGITGTVYVPTGTNAIRKGKNWESEAA